MKKYLFLIIILGATVSFMSCEKPKPKQMPLAEETDVTIPTTAPQEAVQNTPVAAGQTPQTAGNVQQAASDVQQAVQEAAPMAEEEFSAPTTQQLQEALKNAGFYQGEVDGKIGAKSKQAIKDFQTQNNLAVDGKVGPKTWAKLSTYLNKTAQPSTDASHAPSD